MFKKELPIIFIGLSVVIAVLVLGWAVFVKTEMVAPVWVPVVDNDLVADDGNEEIIPDDIVLPDLEVKNLQYYRGFNSPRVGDQIGYEFDIINNGKVPVDGTFRAEFYCEKILLSSPTYIEYHLSPNESITVNTSTDTVFTKSEMVNLSVVIDSANEIEESNEDNNTTKTTIEVLPIVIADNVNVSKPEIDISDWKTYRNEEYEFEMKYPKEFSFWEALNSSKIPEIIDIGFRPDDLQGSVLIITIIDIPLQELSTHEHSVYGDPTDERVKIDNLAGTKFSGYCSKMIGVQKGEYTFFFSSHLMREKESVIFDQMLSTFKFINP